MFMYYIHMITVSFKSMKKYKTNTIEIVKNFVKNKGPRQFIFCKL